MFYWQTHKSNWWSYLLKSILIVLTAFILITVALYIAFHGIWGPDNAIHILDSIATYKELPVMQVLMEKYTSGEGRLTQYFQWLGDFFRGEWGDSIIREVPIRDLVF